MLQVKTVAFEELHHERMNGTAIGRQPVTIDSQEDVHYREGHPLVTINERMISGLGFQVARRLRE